jgi:c-di-GMP-binding flagellar brake protein YcgR
MPETPFERRSADRRNTKNFVDYEVVSPEGATLGRGLARTLNMSATGVLLETGQSFEVGQSLRLTAVLANDMVQMTGRVVHSEPVDGQLCSAGVQFIEFSGPSLQIFQHYCASLS